MTEINTLDIEIIFNEKFEDDETINGNNELDELDNENKIDEDTVKSINKLSAEEFIEIVMKCKTKIQIAKYCGIKSIIAVNKFLLIENIVII